MKTKQEVEDELKGVVDTINRLIKEIGQEEEGAERLTILSVLLLAENTFQILSWVLSADETL